MPFLAGKTNTASALNMARTQMFTVANGDRLNVPNFVIIITDGQSNINPTQTLPEAIEARISGIHIIVVSINQAPPNLEIRGMASAPDSNNILSITDFSQLTTIQQTLIQATCDCK